MVTYLLPEEDQMLAFSSMSKYFANGITCRQNVNGFYKLPCIEGTSQSCSRKRPFQTEHFETSDFTFNEFVVEVYEYENKKLEIKKASRTVRKTYKNNFAEFESFAEKSTPSITLF